MNKLFSIYNLLFPLLLIYSHLAIGQDNSPYQSTSKVAEEVLQLHRDSIKYYRDKAVYFLGNDFDSTKFYAKSLIHYGDYYGNFQIKASGYTLLAAAFEQEGDYEQSIQYKFKALDTYESIDYQAGVSSVHNNIGVFFFRQKKYDEALQHYQKALEVIRKIKLDETFTIADKSSFISDFELNIGEAYLMLGDYQKAKQHELKSLILANEYDLEINKAYIFGILGQITFQNQQYKEAISLYVKAISIFENQDDFYAVAEYYLKKSQAERSNSQSKDALNSAHKALEIAQSLSAKEWERDAYKEIYLSQKEMGKIDLALHNLEQSTQLKDSIIGENIIKNLQELQTKYHSEKKENHIKMLEKDALIKQKILSEQRYFIYGSILFLVLIAVFTLKVKKKNMTLRVAFNDIKEKNQEIQSQQEEILTQNESIEQKNKELNLQHSKITSSIQYALRIQRSILPSKKTLQDLFQEFTLFYLPRDIVSGDIYYYAKVELPEGEQHILASIDCTGHGVPGALMSMIGYEKLNEIILQQKITAPAKILSTLHQGIRKALKQESMGNSDGMDMSIVSIDFHQKKLRFAGAKNPLLVFNDEDFLFIKGSRVSIGGYQHETNRQFKEHEISFEKPIYFYLFTDGYQDQFGGEKSKKYGIKKLILFLQQNHHLSGHQLSEKLKDNYFNWMKKAHEFQVDDVLVIGGKLQ